MLSDELNFYLNHLSQYLAPATVASHRSTLTRFVNESRSHKLAADDLDVQWVAEYLSKDSGDYRPTTLRGKISTIANFVAYFQKEDPELLRERIERILSRQDGDVDSSHEYSDLDYDGLQTAVEAYLEYVRSRAYGTRVHAVTEVIAATGCRLTSLQALNLEDLDIDGGEIELGVSEKYAVGQTDLVGTRTGALPEERLRALRTYIEHERIPWICTDEPEPLFTTCHGRASIETLQRSIQAMMRAALGDSHSADLACVVTQVDSDGECVQLSPKHIRRYYIIKVTEE